MIKSTNEKMIVQLLVFVFDSAVGNIGSDLSNN